MLNWIRPVLMGLGGFAVAGCSAAREGPPPRQSSLDPTPYTALILADGTPVSPEAWRPAWWIDAPVHNAWGISAAAFGTDKDLLASRRQAIEEANRLLAGALDEESGSAAPPQSRAEAPASKADTVRLTDGSYRTFVLLTAPPKGT